MAAQIYNPFMEANLYRNPRFKNAGRIVSLSDFLAFAKNATSVSGVLIRIEVSLSCVTWYRVMLLMDVENKLQILRRFWKY